MMGCRPATHPWSMDTSVLIAYQFLGGLNLRQDYKCNFKAYKAMPIAWQLGHTHFDWTRLLWLVTHPLPDLTNLNVLATGCNWAGTGPLSILGPLYLNLLVVLTSLANIQKVPNVVTGTLRSVGPFSPKSPTMRKKAILKWIIRNVTSNSPARGWWIWIKLSGSHYTRLLFYNVALCASRDNNYGGVVLHHVTIMWAWLGRGAAARRREELRRDGQRLLRLWVEGWLASP